MTSQAIAKDDAINMKWFRAQVRRYKKQRTHYQRFADLLEAYLKHAVGPICKSAIVEARPKEVESFAAKILRQKKDWEKEHGKDPDLVNLLTDLCGARAVVHLKSQVASLGQRLHKDFDVLEVTGDESSSRHRTREFGYESQHYIVRLKPAVFKSKRFTAGGFSYRVTEGLRGLRAEIQLRTIAQHAWADIGHERLYKQEFKLPVTWERDSARIAALLESADEAFSQLAAAVESLHVGGRYLSHEAATTELALQEAVLPHAVHPEVLQERIARLLLRLERPEEAIKRLNEFRAKPRVLFGSSLFAVLGQAYCRKARFQPGKRDLATGRRHLKTALDDDPSNIEALTCLAMTWVVEETIVHGKHKALECYRRAFEADPHDPNALAGFLRYKINEEASTSIVEVLRPNIEAALRECEAQVQAGVNLPEAHYHIALFEGLLDRPYLSLNALARAISLTEDPNQLDRAIIGARLLQEPVETELPHAKWLRLFLLLARHTRANGRIDKELQDLATPGAKRIKPPVVIVAGGCDPEYHAEMSRYGDLLRTVFKDFNGTIISGGTEQGICGVVGALTSETKSRLHSIGYLPKTLPSDGSATRDRRYSEIRFTEGQAEFTALEPLQNWIDLVASKIKPAEVKLLGINGGCITAFEYRLAAALGAQVGVVRHSGREANRVAEEKELNRFPGLFLLPKDPLTLKTFIDAPFEHDLAPVRETLARGFHSVYCRTRAQKANEDLHRDEPSLQPWPALLPVLKESNRAQVDHIRAKLRAVGLTLHRVTRGRVVVIKLTKDEVDHLAELEHARYNVERIITGWTPGARNAERRTNPYLVPWNELDDDVKEFDEAAVRAIPELLAKVGYEIRRPGGGAAAPGRKARGRAMAT